MLRAALKTPRAALKMLRAALKLPRVALKTKFLEKWANLREKVAF